MKIRIADDKAHVEEVRKALKANDGHCPCQIKKTADTKCICREFLEQESGECLCGLYVKVEER